MNIRPISERMSPISAATAPFPLHSLSEKDFTGLVGATKALPKPQQQQGLRQRRELRRPIPLFVPTLTIFPVISTPNNLDIESLDDI